MRVNVAKLLILEQWMKISIFLLNFFYIGFELSIFINKLTIFSIGTM